MAATRIVQVLDFASARAPELQALHEVAHHAQMQAPADAKLVSQRNQRRRRANAFKSHRMPQRLRQKRTTEQHEPEELIALQTSNNAAAQVTSSKSDTTASVATGAQEDKQRCRKHERRPHKLTAARSWQAVRTTAAAIDGSTSTSTAPTAAAWMATHVWHSKRMKMIEKFGAMVPAHRADKSVSASLQALRSSATLHDLSYYGVLELYGLPQLILEALQLVSDPAGSDFHGMRFLAGAEEGQSMLYHEGQFPSGAICPVTFMWRPLATDSRSETVDKTNDDSSGFELHADWQATKRQLWLWIHPAAFMEAASAIASACDAVVDDNDRDSVIQVLDRRGHLCRFKLRGARADEILASVCAADSAAASAEVEIESSLDADSDHDDGFSASATAQQCARTNLALLRQHLNAKASPSAATTVRSRVYSVALSDPRVRDRTSTGHAKQSSSALSLLSEPTPSELALVDEIRCPVSLAPLTEQGHGAEEPESALILDKLSAILRWADGPSADATSYPFSSPLASEGTHGRSDDVAMVDASGAGGLVPSSYLWSESKRAHLSQAFRKDHELNATVFQARRARTLATTATNLSTNASLSKLHVLALEKREPFPKTSGWDLIVSPSFASVLLKTLVFAGALVVGIDEDEALDTVLERPSFPRDYPDTLAGKTYWQAEADARMAEHLRKPKAKRFAYAKHGIESPFQPNWTQLFASGASDDEAKNASGAGEADEDDDEDDDSGVCVLRGDEYMQPFCFYAPSQADATTTKALEKIPVAVPTLVRVVLRVPGRGSLTPNAMLLLPTADDLACISAQPNWRGRELTPGKPDERSVVGFVTSAVYDRPKGAFRATGFCACDLLQDVVLQQHASSKLPPREALVLLQTPHAKMLRPVLIRAQA